MLNGVHYKSGKMFLVAQRFMCLRPKFNLFSGVVS